MQRPAETDACDDPALDADSPGAGVAVPAWQTPCCQQAEARNFVLLASQQVLLRVGWIFKTESVIMPAFMAFIGGDARLQSLLMVLNRFGFSIPPVLAARWLGNRRHKKYVTAACTTGMALPFVAMAVIWFSGVWRTASGGPQWWMPAVFLTLYGVFFVLTGLNQLTTHTLQGKLMRPDLRGRLFSAGVLVGSPLAILAAVILMPAWLGRDDGGFGFIFVMAAVAFLGAGLAGLGVREPADEHFEPAMSAVDTFRLSWLILRHQKLSRELALVAMLFSGTFLLFPHFQSLVRGRGAVPLGDMLLWVCVQNVATAVVGLAMGPLADRCGNRLAVALTMAGAATAPAMGLLLLSLPSDWVARLGWLVFVPLGFTPVTLKLLINYMLEIVEPRWHTRYVSTLGLCVAVPVMVLAPLVGWSIDQWGHAPAMWLGLGLAIWGCKRAWGLAEPRQLNTTT